MTDRVNDGKKKRVQAKRHCSAYLCKSRCHAAPQKGIAARRFSPRQVVSHLFSSHLLRKFLPLLLFRVGIKDALNPGHLQGYRLLHNNIDHDDAQPKVRDRGGPRKEDESVEGNEE